MKSRIARVVLLAVLAYALPSPSTAQVQDVTPPNPASGLSKPTGATQGRIVQSYGNLPLSFEANQGQTDASVKFLSRGPGYTLFLTGNEAVLSLRGAEKGADNLPSSLRNRLQKHIARDAQRTKIAVLRMKVAGANPNAPATGVDELPGKSNYFIGNDPKQWRTNVANYTKVRYQGVYPGIDLVYYGNQRQLEYDFVVAPRARPESVTLEFQGADSMEVDTQGDLVLHIAGREIREYKPMVYQEVDGARKLVECRYVLRGKAQAGFSIERYDTTKPLTIDPALAYSTYLGGSTLDQGNGIAVDTFGSAYVTGVTDSPDFPTTTGAFQTVFTGNLGHAFVTKLNATGTALVYSTYLGGTDDDYGNAIVVDTSGNAYVTGYTQSADFPTTPGAFQSTFDAAGDAFVTKLNATGNALVYSTRLGGSALDWGYGIAVDTSGSAYVTGFTISNNFPTTPGAFQTITHGPENAFVTKLNATGTALVYSTYLGGSVDDAGDDIAVDAAGSAYVAGTTYSADFPTTAGAFQTVGTGTIRGFITKLDPTGTTLAYSTFLQVINCLGIAVDAAGNAYVTGDTDSATFPVTAGAFQTTFGGAGDAFVSKLNATGTALVYSTFLSGSTGYSQGSRIAVDAAGNAYVTGWTDSATFPVTAGAFQTTLGGGTDNAYVAKLNAVGTGLVYSSYLGGSANDRAFGLAIDNSGNAYVTGNALSTNFPTTPGSFQTMLPSSAYGHAFVAKFQIGAVGTPDLTITKSHTGSFTQGQTGATYTITAMNSGTATTSATVTVMDTLPAALTATAMSGTSWICTLATLTCTSTTVESAGASFPAITLTVTVATNAPAGVTNMVTVSGGGEANTSNDTATDPTTINPLVVLTPDLTISKTHTGYFTPGQIGATYFITATNSGTAATSGTVTVVDTLPGGLTATAMSGSGWMCTLSTLTCTTVTVEAAGANFPPIMLTVNVAGNSAEFVTNIATVSGGGETNTSNNMATDPTIITSTPPITTLADVFQIRYAANLNIGDAYVDITNSGASDGNICANVYTFDPAEELISCCTCNVTPNGLQSLSVLNSLISNPVTPPIPISIVIKLVSTTGTCNASVISTNNLASGMLAWGTSLHEQPTSPVSYGLTETPFSLATLSAAELAHITSTCSFIQSNGSGFGICKGCAAGGLGAGTSVQ